MRLLLVLFLLLLPAAAPAQNVPKLVPDVSQQRIDIQSGFTGAELLLFGAIIYPRGVAPEGSLAAGVSALGAWAAGKANDLEVIAQRRDADGPMIDPEGAGGAFKVLEHRRVPEL